MNLIFTLQKSSREDSALRLFLYKLPENLLLKG